MSAERVLGWHKCGPKLKFSFFYLLDWLSFHLIHRTLSVNVRKNRGPYTIKHNQFGSFGIDTLFSSSKQPREREKETKLFNNFIARARGKSGFNNIFIYLDLKDCISLIVKWSCKQAARESTIIQLCCTLRVMKISRQDLLSATLAAQLTMKFFFR